MGSLGFGCFRSARFPFPLQTKQMKNIPVQPPAGSRSARKGLLAGWPARDQQQHLRAAERGLAFPGPPEEMSLTCAGSRGSRLRRGGTQGPGPRRKASAPACLCWVCRERTSGQEAAACPRTPAPPPPVPISPQLPNPSREQREAGCHVGSTRQDLGRVEVRTNVRPAMTNPHRGKAILDHRGPPPEGSLHGGSTQNRTPSLLRMSPERESFHPNGRCGRYPVPEKQGWKHLVCGHLRVACAATAAEGSAPARVVLVGVGQPDLPGPGGAQPCPGGPVGEGPRLF